jgi:DUF4097 and DUF4098 domain-containing protein YvlB
MMLRLLPWLAFATGCAGGPRIATTIPPVPIAGHVQVRITTNDGSVRVSSADIPQVELHVETIGYDVSRDLELSMTPRGSQVDIVANIRKRVQFFQVRRRSLQILVRVPRDADVEVRSGDGSVELEAVGGSVDVDTGDGSVAVRGARGSIRLRTGDGSIHGRDLDGAVDATTGDGSVSLEGRFDILAVKTGDGKLVASAQPGSRVAQPWHLQTGDGSIALALPRDLGAHLDASTNDGRVRSTIPLLLLESSRAQGDINGGGPPIVVRTGDGSIDLSQL